MKSVDLSGVDLLVLLSPHAAASGAYESTGGSLAPFGVEGIEVLDNTDAAAAKELMDVADLAPLDPPVDHGVVVPLRVGAWEAPTVAVGLAESGSPEETLAAARSVVAGIAHLAESRRVAVVASANGSAGLSARAPLTELRGAADAEEELLGAAGENWGALGSCAARLSEVGGSCARGPLEVLARLFAGKEGRVLAHERPVGVGYTVAVTNG